MPGPCAPRRRTATTSARPTSPTSASVIDFDAIRGAGVRMGVDPLGGAGVHYWAAIAERYRLELTVVSEVVDATFRFMTLDWDGQIRMDPSSPYAMRRLVALKDRFDIAFACDTDHDRHGIVTAAAGLLPPNHYLAVAIDYLFRAAAAVERAGGGRQDGGQHAAHRPRGERGSVASCSRCRWASSGSPPGCSTAAWASAARRAPARRFLRRDGSVWTTDKDGIIAALLAAEITAHSGRDPGALYLRTRRRPR